MKDFERLYKDLLERYNALAKRHRDVVNEITDLKMKLRREGEIDE